MIKKTKKQKKQDEQVGKRLQYLLKTYAGFTFMPDEEKIKVIRLCGILAYMEEAKKRDMDISTCINGIIGFLDIIKEKYVSDNERGENAI